MSDLARHRRHRVQAACIVRSTRDDALLGDSTLDISYSGIHVATVGKARLGERVRVSVQIPQSAVWLEGTGRVERVSLGRRADDEGPSFGVRIDRMDGMKRVLLTKIVSRYPAVLARRGVDRDYAKTVERIERTG